MSLSILTNTSSLQAQSALNNTSQALSTSLQRLSTGLKINSGADGPAAYVIAQAQAAQSAGLSTAIDNTNQAVSLVQTGEGALSEISTLLTQARSLALNSANAGVNNTAAFTANQSQLTNILNTITTIATSTQFNGKNLLDGTGLSNGLSSGTTGATFTGSATATINPNGYTFAVGTAAARAQAVGGGAFAVSAAGTFTVSNGTTTASANLLTTDSVDQAVSKINTALQSAGITSIQASNGYNSANGGALVLTASDYTTNITVGGTATVTNGPATATHTNAVVTYTDSNGNTVSSTGTGNVVSLNGELGGVNLTLGNSPTAGSVSSISTAITAAAGNGFTFQIGANENQTTTVNFKRIASDSIGLYNGSYLNSATVTSATTAQSALYSIDQAISDVSTFSGQLGAFQSNTLQATAANLQTSLTNTNSSLSTTQDTNFAAEIANYTKLQTQLQAGTSVLSNANQTTQLITQLLAKA